MSDLFTVHKQVFDEMTVTIRIRGQQFWQSQETISIVDQVNTKFRLIYGTGGITRGSGDYEIVGGITLYLQKNVNNGGWNTIKEFTQNFNWDDDPFGIFGTNYTMNNYPNFACSAEWNFGEGQQEIANYNILNDTEANTIQVMELSESGWINFNMERNLNLSTEPYTIRNYETSSTITVYMLPSQPQAMMRLNMYCKIEKNASSTVLWCKSDRVYFYARTQEGTLYAKAKSDLMIQGGTSQGGEVSKNIDSIGDITGYYKSCGNVNPTTETQTPLNEYVTCPNW